MVYCGKRSTACGHCRERRTSVCKQLSRNKADIFDVQCSRGMPCRQCARKRLPCGGYQNLLDLSFRDETNSIMLKMHHRVQRLDPDTEESATGITTAPRKGLDLLHTLRPNQSVVDIAVPYFLKSYLPDTTFSFVLDMSSEFSSSVCFNLSTNAVALATLARERKDGQLMCVSRTIYIKAIKQVNLALKSSEVDNNGTLVATLILGLFEAIVLSGGNTPNSSSNESSCLDSWIAHTNGTMSLLRYRGEELLETDFGKKIYYQVANRVRANCSQKRIRLPPDFLEIDKKMAPLVQNLDPTARFWKVVDMVIEMGVRLQGKQRQETIL
jgi:hypothetical protein